jgi:hypothetical protein
LGLKAKEMEGITDHANRVMKEGIENLTVEIVNNYYVGKDDKRKNELSNAVKISLNKVANRIDQGFNVEVRAEPAEEVTEEADGEEQQQKNQEFVNKIIEASKTLQFLKLDGERLLGLPEKTVESKSSKK